MSFHLPSQLLTPAEAQCAADELLGLRRRVEWSDTAVNMATVSLGPDGAVTVHLLESMEHHPSVAAFLQAYGLAMSGKDASEQRQQMA